MKPKPTKDKHPLASRIRKMMRADDDVGKIAQATPVLICECLLPCITHRVRAHQRVSAAPSGRARTFGRDEARRPCLVHETSLHRARAGSKLPRQCPG